MAEDNNEEFRFEERNSYIRKESRVKKANLVLLIVGCALLVFVLVFSIIFICGKGFKDRPSGEYERPFYYELNADGTGYEVTGMNERYRNVEIPAEYNGLPVTGIAEYAFNRCNSLKSLTMPDTVTSIGAYAFQNCTSLTSVTISGSVTNIGYGVFYNCRSLAEVTIPDGVTRIGTDAFEYCYSLTEMIIPGSVTSIGNDAFYQCSALTGVYISSIDEWAAIDFGNESANPLCYAGNLYLNGELVTEVNLSDSVTKISNYAFYECTSLTSVTIGESVTNIGNSAFYRCTSLTSITIPDGVTSIGNYAFYGCTSLTSAMISDGVDNIGSNAFSNCASLTEIAIPDSVTSIGNYAFSFCYSLGVVYIPESVEYIGRYAFEDCYNLLIFAGVKSRPSGWDSAWNYSSCPVYWGVSGIPTENVTYTFETNGGSTVASISEPWLTALPTTTRDGYIFTGWYLDPDLSGESRVTVPYYTGYDVTLYAGWIAGYQSEGLEVINGVVTGIGTCTDSVLYISLPIEAEAFYGCDQITEVYLYDGCTSIGAYAFGYCRNLKSVYFGQTEVPEIDSYIFYSHDSNFRVYVPSDLYSQYQTITSSGWIDDIVDRSRLYTF